MVDPNSRFNRTTTCIVDNCDGSGGIELTLVEKNCSAQAIKKGQLAGLAQLTAVVQEQFANVPD
jgi:hypothetical protein